MLPLPSDKPETPEPNFLGILKKNGNKETFSFEDIQDTKTRIGSIRAKSLKNPRAPPNLGWRERKNWVKLNIGKDGNNPNYILVNIDSISEKTGLAKTDILAAAKDQTSFKNFLHQAIKDSVALEQRISETDSGVSNEKLEKMVITINKLKKRMAVAKSKNKNIQFSAKKEWKGSLSAYVSPEGNVYLSNLSQRIGNGAFKNVWGGIDITKERVVVGIPREYVGSRSDEIDEINMLREVRGPGICRYHICFEIERSGFFGRLRKKRVGVIMPLYNAGHISSLELITNDTLEQGVKDLAFIMHNLAIGLQRLHNKGITHSDIKYDNVFIHKDEEGRVVDAVLADLGCARHTSDQNDFNTDMFKLYDVLKASFLSSTSRKIDGWSNDAQKRPYCQLWKEMEDLYNDMISKSLTIDQFVERISEIKKKVDELSNRGAVV